MIRPVIKDHTEIDHRITSQIAASRRILDSFFNGRNIIFRNRAAENIVDEFKLSAARHRLHFDFAIAILAVAAGLFFVPPLHVGFAANRLAIRHFRSLQNHFGVVALFQLRHHHFNVLLSRACNQKFLSLRIAEESQHGIFFHQLVDSRTQLVFIGAALGLDGKSDRRLRQLHSRILNRRRLISQRVAGERVF